MVWFVLGHSGQRTSVKCAEATWNYKSGGVVHLKSPAVFFSVKKNQCDFQCYSDCTLSRCKGIARAPSTTISVWILISSDRSTTSGQMTQFPTNSNTNISRHYIEDRLMPVAGHQTSKRKSWRTFINLLLIIFCLFCFVLFCFFFCLFQFKHAKTIQICVHLKSVEIEVKQTKNENITTLWTKKTENTILQTFILKQLKDTLQSS